MGRDMFLKPKSVAYRMKSTALTALLISSAVNISGVPAVAQVVEENPAPLIFGKRTSALTPYELVDISDDPTPFGVPLNKLVIVDTRLNGDKIVNRSEIASGIDAKRASNIVQGSDFQGRLAGFMGKPLSFKMIRDIQQEITKQYRSAGRPLVNIVVPPQEISDNGLQINVTTFVLDEKRVEGKSRENTEFLEKQILLSKNEEINSKRLIDDIDWLSQNPYRKVQGVFEPGKEPGTTNVILEIEELRPWSAYAGVSNSGTDATGLERLFFGFNTTNLPGADHQLSYRFTVSPDTLGRGGLFDAGNDKGYLSHAASYFIPITTNSGERYKLTFEANYVDSYAISDTIVSARNKTAIFGVEFAKPLQKRDGKWDVSPELYTKIAYKDYDKETFFAGISAANEATKSAQLSVGIRGRVSGNLFDKPSNGHFDVSLETGKSNTSGLASRSFTYLQFSGDQELALTNQTSLLLRVRGQFSGVELHPLEQMGFGGGNTVRGYETNDVSSQSGIAANIEYRAKPWVIEEGKFKARIRPYAFTDFAKIAKVKGIAGSNSESMHSVGLGLSAGFGKNFSAKLEIGHALSDAGSSKSGSNNAQLEFVARF